MKLLLSNILYNLILTLFRFSVKFTVKFNHNSDLTLFHLKVSDTGCRMFDRYTKEGVRGKVEW